MSDDTAIAIEEITDEDVAHVLDTAQTDREDSPISVFQKKIDFGASLNTDQKHVNAVAETTNLEAIDLPSGYMFYDAEAINIRKFKYREFELITAAQEASSFRSLAEAIVRTTLGINGMELTYGDFTALMYYHKLRVNRPYDIEWECDSDKHLDWVEKGYKGTNKEELITPESLNRRSTIRRSKIKMINPDGDRLVKLFTRGRGSELFDGLELYPPRLADVIDAEEAIEELNRRALTTGDEEEIDYQQLEVETAKLKYRNDLASLLHPTHGKTLAERRDYWMKWLEANEADDNENGIDTGFVLAHMTEFREACHHTVEETATVKCEVCATEKELPILFSPTEFFPLFQKS